MRQNRVDPRGGLHAVAARGAWMGNRGCLHDAQGRIRRGWQGRRWITCVTEFRGRKRVLMQPGRYTELFFLDEATAYAAGHRPCAECRHAEWTRFRALWEKLSREGALGEAPVLAGWRADAIDRVLHAARLRGRARRLVPMVVEEVPVGAMVVAGGAVLLRAGSSGWWQWGVHGYAPARAPRGAVMLLTPWPVARLMAAGLALQIDGSARPG